MRYALLGFLILSLVGNGIFFGVQSGLKSDKNKAILKMDSLLSVKLLVDKELNQAKTEIESCKGISNELDKKILSMDSELSASKIQVEKLVKDNASVGSLRKKLKESQKLRDDCEKIVNDYIKDNERLEAQNKTLNKSVNTLSQQLEELNAKLALAKNPKAYDMVIVNYKVSKRSNKPTIRARKVNRIAATFDISANPVADSGPKEVFMVVYDSNNKVIGPQNNKFSNKSANKEQVYSTSKPLDYKNAEVSMTINFDTDIKLVKGKFKVEIYIDGILSGKKDFNLK
jgi:hypothetical protein